MNLEQLEMLLLHNQLLADANRDLRGQLDALKSWQKNANWRLNRSEEELEDELEYSAWVDRQLFEADEEVRQSHADISWLQDELEKTEVERDFAVEARQYNDGKTKALRTECDALRAENVALNAKLFGLAGDLDAVDAAYDALCAENKVLRTITDERTESIIALSAENQVLRTKCERLNADLDVATETICVLRCAIAPKKPRATKRKK